MLLEEVCRLRTTSETLTIRRFLSSEGRDTKEDSVAKDMLMRCAEDAASRTTSEMKAITSQLLQDAAERDRRHAERDAAFAEKPAGLVKVVSESADSKICNLSQSVDSKN